MLSLQITTQLKIRLTINNLVLYRKTFNNFNQKIVFLSIFINKFILYSSFNFSKKNVIIFSLIKNVQEFDLQCKQIFNQLLEKLKKNLLFVLHKNKILKKTNHV